MGRISRGHPGVIRADTTPNMAGRPGCRTMEMNGGSSAPYLACTPCVPLFCTSFNRCGSTGAFRLPGAGGGSFPLYGGTFARSYSVPKNFGQAPQILEKTSMSARTSMTRRLWKTRPATAQNEKVRTSTTPRDFQKLQLEKHWAEFSFPNFEKVLPP